MGHLVNPQMVTLAREARGLSQSAFARKGGLSQGTLSKIEAGLLIASEESLEAIVRAAQMPEGFFFQTDTIYGASVSEFYHYGRSGERDSRRTRKPRRRTR